MAFGIEAPFEFVIIESQNLANQPPCRISPLTFEK